MEGWEAGDVVHREWIGGRGGAEGMWGGYVCVGGGGAGADYIHDYWVGWVGAGKGHAWLEADVRWRGSGTCEASVS